MASIQIRPDTSIRLDVSVTAWSAVSVSNQVSVKQQFLNKKTLTAEAVKNVLPIPKSHSFAISSSRLSTSNFV